MTHPFHSRAISRRNFLQKLAVSGAVLGGLNFFENRVFALGNSNSVRRFHISLQAEAWLTQIFMYWAPLITISHQYL